MEITVINSALGASALVGVAYITARMNRPGQKETAEKEFRTSLIDCAKMAPDLMKANQDLMVANVKLQDALEDQKRVTEERERTITAQAAQVQDLSARLDALEKQVPGLRGQITTLKNEVKDLKKLLADRDADLAAAHALHQDDLLAAQETIDTLNAQVEAALRAQERAEGALAGTRQTIQDQAVRDQADCA